MRPFWLRYGPPFGFAKGDLDADGEACDAPCGDVIRLKSAGMSTREIAAVGDGPFDGSVDDPPFRDGGAELALSDGITDTELEARLFARAGAGPGTRRAIAGRPNRTGRPCIVSSGAACDAGDPVGRVHRGRTRRVPLFALLWLYRAWEGRLSVTMRQSHAAGDKLFVDYAATACRCDRSAQRRAARRTIFVAVLGASSFTYAQATWTQGLADWISGHVGASRRSAGCPRCWCRTHKSLS